LLLVSITLLASLSTTSAMQQLHSFQHDSSLGQDSLHNHASASGWRAQQHVQHTHLGNAHLVQQLSRVSTGCFRHSGGKPQ
jgi:hypothetical protein